MTYSKSEVGHALNVANLEKLILTSQLLGANYNPSSRQLQIGNLYQLLQNGKNAIDQVASSLNTNKNAINLRQEAFKALKPLATRVMGALISTGASLPTIKDARTINDKLQGRGKNVPRPKKEDGETTNSNGETTNSNGETTNSNGETTNSNGETTNSNGETTNSNGETTNSNGETTNSNSETTNSNSETRNSNGETTNSNGKTRNSNSDADKPKVKKKRLISTVQQSYAQIVGHFAQLVNFLQQTPSYNPNESELQLANLVQVLNNLQIANTNVIQTEITLQNARILRDEALYNPTIGLVTTALLVKEYCKSVLSSTSPVYRQVNKIRFNGKK